MIRGEEKEQEVGIMRIRIIDDDGHLQIRDQDFIIQGNIHLVYMLYKMAVLGVKRKACLSETSFSRLDQGGNK